MVCVLENATRYNSTFGCGCVTFWNNFECAEGVTWSMLISSHAVQLVATLALLGFLFPIAVLLLNHKCLCRTTPGYALLWVIAGTIGLVIWHTLSIFDIVHDENLLEAYHTSFSEMAKSMAILTGNLASILVALVWAEHNTSSSSLNYEVTRFRHVWPIIAAVYMFVNFLSWAFNYRVVRLIADLIMNVSCVATNLVAGLRFQQLLAVLASRRGNLKKLKDTASMVHKTTVCLVASHTTLFVLRGVAEIRGLYKIGLVTHSIGFMVLFILNVVAQVARKITKHKHAKVSSSGEQQEMVINNNQGLARVKHVLFSRTESGQK